MKILQKRIFIWCILIIFSLSLSGINVFAASDELKHFGISSVFGIVSESCLHYKTDFNTTERVFLGTMLGSVPGLVKEFIDSTKKDNYFSERDLAFDIAGSFFGALIGNIFNNFIQVKVNSIKNHKAVVISLSCRF
ncbi:MAG: hypothetical protein ACETWK_07085 [Candidatus Aminicenantaceae bacterium]